MVEFELEVPHWEALQQTFKHYQCEGWGIVAPEIPSDWGWPESHTRRKLDGGRVEDLAVIESDDFTLTARTLYDPHEPSWQTERFIKNFQLDWPVYECQVLPPPEELLWVPVQEALDTVGEDYLLEVYIGLTFIDFAGNQRQGGLEQVIRDLYDHPKEMRALQERYIAWIAEKTQQAFTKTNTRSVFIASIWSTLSLLSPSLWRTWDKPVLETIVRVAHANGGLVHHHFHGKCNGVTGSGKTEVYLAAARATIAGGRRVLVLVPEVALAHQVVHAFRGRFGDRVGVLHSYLALGERRATWERARRGGLDVVVGARSAVFAPLPDLGLIVVDEEHEAAYKQEESPRYHGRDVAVMRARLEGVPVVLGSATPSLESQWNVAKGKYSLSACPRGWPEWSAAERETVDRERLTE